VPGVAQRQPVNEEKQKQSNNDEKSEEKKEEQKDENITNLVRIDLTGDDRHTRRVMRDIVKSQNEQRNGQ
jgi:hypothetical protein